MLYLEGMGLMVQALRMNGKILNQQMNNLYPQAPAATASELNRAASLSSASLVIIGWI